MPRIRFTADPKLPRDLKHLGYRKDTEVDLSQDQADRWLRRGVAVVIPDAPVQRPAPRQAASPVVEKPAEKPAEPAAPVPRPPLRHHSV